MAERTQEGFKRFFRYLEETDLAEPLRVRAARHGATLFAIYMDDPSLAASAARLEAWWHLTTEACRSPEEVARLFDRSRSSILHGLRLLDDQAEQSTVNIAPDTIAILAQLAVKPRARKAS